MLQSVETFAAPDYGVDVFKLESPLAAADIPGVGAEGWEDAQVWFDRLGEAAGRPWVMLSAGAGMEEFRNILTHAFRAGASGYLAGRAIWQKAFAHFPDWDAIRRELQTEAIDYMRDLNALTNKEATPWMEHPLFKNGGVDVSPADASFRQHYAGFGGVL